ncbi:flagellar hook-length control protein FliK [Ornithinibacillus salinisoli]|uniref:Flagellar hook-length control protein FliK n=1 Tax=Ornithinibacillus salinisoli TaxID=1848459 RepID=A0ABW4VZS1_9BACI
MNALGLLLISQAGKNVLPVSTNKQDTTKDGDMFQELLLQLGNERSEDSVNLSGNKVNVLSEIMNSSPLALQWMDGLEPFETNQTMLGQQSQLNELSEQLQDVDHELLELTLQQLEIAEDGQLLNLESVNMDLQDNIALQGQFMEIFSKMSTIIQGISTDQDMKKAAPKILDLLQQWTALNKNSGNEKNIMNLVTQEGTKDQGVLKDLLQSFQKRNQLVSNHQYNSDAKVTSTDVVKWLRHAMQKHSQGESTLNQSVNATVFSTTPITKLEQFVIHVNQTQEAKPVDKQLMDQVQKVMKSSKFLSMANGTNQLSLTLRPENLGDMMVKLTQVNGEMTVKIMVTSQATKEMLESNMNQLKNMFSPHQVSIEKQDVNTQQQGQNLQKDQEGQAFKEQNDNQDGHSPSDQGQQQDNDLDFESTFKDLILNEKV